MIHRLVIAATAIILLAGLILSWLDLQLEPVKANFARQAGRAWFASEQFAAGIADQTHQRAAAWKSKLLWTFNLQSTDDNQSLIPPLTHVEEGDAG
jgi:hypothetical protein